MYNENATGSDTVAFSSLPQFCCGNYQGPKPCYNCYMFLLVFSFLFHVNILKKDSSCLPIILDYKYQHLLTR
jgi:hypothetical protein